MFTCNFALRQCTEYFVSRGSTVFMAALDAKKAFDRVNHIKLFHLMCDIGVPVHIIRLPGTYELIFKNYDLFVEEWC